MSQLQGSSVNFSYTVVPTEGVGIWIDWNQNGSFLDAGEQVYNAGSYVSSGSGTISVLLSQPAGNYRMRIVGNWLSTSPTPCGDLGSAGYGEAEDYTFTVIPLSNCSGTPAPGNTLSNPATACIGQNINLSLQNSVVGAGITFDWQSSPDGVTWTSTGGTLPSYTTTQSAATWYQCIVTCTNSGQSATSTPVQVTMSPFYNCYCTTGLGGSCAINSLSSVAIATTTLNNVTGGCTGTYNSFPASGSTTASLVPGVPYTMTAGCISGSNTQVAIWIDYNQNGIFETTEYTLINGNIPSGGSGSGTFTIPITALSGNTGMRVRSDWQGTTAWTSADACTNRTWGETEDYTITILIPNSCSGTPSSSVTTASVASVCPGGNVSLGTNPFYTDGGLTFDWQSSPDGITYTSTGITSQTYNVTGFSATTWYQCVVTCTNGGLSTTSTPVQVSLNPFYNCYCTTSLHSSSTPCINEIDLNTLSNNTAAA
ncbi:MAG TPA: GEVED domain-containing protein, partial [Bacteroidia bacterium]|nr:GEVED domain-containing protein [Bacteroidia bacterium]